MGRIQLLFTSYFTYFSYLPNLTGLFWLVVWAIFVLLDLWKKDVGQDWLCPFFILIYMKEIQKYGLIFLSALLIFPAIINLAHVFSGHDHHYCNHYSDSHFHKENIDCELFKFQQSPVAHFEIFSFTIFNPEIKTSGFTSLYWFLSEYQKLSFSLRGPPEMVWFRRKKLKKGSSL